MLLAFLSLSVGFVLDTVTHGRREVKRLMYLQNDAPQEALADAATAPREARIARS
jgi:hypothetical protein